MLFYYFTDVEGDDEEDDEGGHADAEEEGHDGRDEVLGNHFRYCPLLQELAEEDNGRDGKYAGHTYEPQVEAAKEQCYVPSLGTMYLAECHFLLSRTGIEGYGAPYTHQTDDEADACEYPRSALHVFK